ncbi:type VII secretion integral membrane protein EccD [Cellulomonas soli]
MSATPASSTPTGTLVRLTVSAGDRRADLGIPGQVAVAEVIPGLARTLGVLDPLTVHGGYWLVRPDGTTLDPARSLLAEGVSDGDVLSLEVGAERPEPRVYDDVVEAVADAVENLYQPWSPRDSALTAAWAAGALLLAVAALLLGADSASLVPALVAGVGAALVLVAGAVVARVGAVPEAARVLVLLASVLGAVAGLTASSEAPSWGWPAAGAGIGLLVTGVLGALAMVDRRELAVAPSVAGLAIAVSGLTVALTGAQADQVLSVVVAVVVTAGIGVPWLALNSTPLRVVPVRSDADVLADTPPVDVAAVRRDLARGHRVQVALRVAVGLVAVVGAPQVVATGVPGTLLLAATFAGMLLSTRQTYARAEVLVVVSLALVGLTVTALLAAVQQPQWRPGLVGVAGAAAALVVALGLVAPRHRVGLARAGDSLELLFLAVLLPLGLAAAGLV